MFFCHTEEQIAEDTGLAQRTVISSIEELKEQGWLGVKGRKRHCNEYTIKWDRVDVKDLHIKSSEVDVKDFPVDVQNLSVDVQKTAPNR